MFFFSSMYIFFNLFTHLPTKELLLFFLFIYSFLCNFLVYVAFTKFVHNLFIIHMYLYRFSSVYKRLCMFKLWWKARN